MTQTIQEKLKIFNELKKKKKIILEEFDKSVDEFSKINETKLNYSNNELNGIEENKKKLVELSQNMEEQKLKEIQEIKIQIKDLENQIKEDNEKYHRRTWPFFPLSAL